MKDTDNSLSRSNYDILLVNIFKNFVLRNNFSKLFFSFSNTTNNSRGKKKSNISKYTESPLF